MKKAKVAVIGGGIAGSSVALYLSKLNIDVTLFEQSKSLVNGPPICHLHAGGNLYREISDEQCVTLLKESIELVRFYPEAIDYRPTLIAVPTDDKGSVASLLPRLKLLEESYQNLIDIDEANKVLKESSEYYKLFSKEEVLHLQECECVTTPKTKEEWMINASKSIDLEKVKFPLIMVEEYGINVFRLASSVTLKLDEQKSATVFLQSRVTSITKNAYKYKIDYIRENSHQSKEFDYIINAAGFRSGYIDDMLALKRKRYVEFKAAYVTKWKNQQTLFPEIIFHGERGTPKGMAQFTPYPNGHFQLHGMSKNITLFEGGLVKSKGKSSQAFLDKKFIKMIEESWETEEVKERTNAAIEHIAQFIPSFKEAEVASKPLYGAQQIPGDDDTLRAAEVSFESDFYARCEIVKASSVITMADAIVKKLIELQLFEQKEYKISQKSSVKEQDISDLAEFLAKERTYPSSLACRNIEN